MSSNTEVLYIHPLCAFLNIASVEYIPRERRKSISSSNSFIRGRKRFPETPQQSFSHWVTSPLLNQLPARRMEYTQSAYTDHLAGGMDSEESTVMNAVPNKTVSHLILSLFYLPLPLDSVSFLLLQPFCTGPCQNVFFLTYRAFSLFSFLHLHLLKIQILDECLHHFDI